MPGHAEAEACGSPKSLGCGMAEIVPISGMGVLVCEQLCLWAGLWERIAPKPV